MSCVIQLNPVQVFVDPHNFAVMNFTSILLTGPTCHINIAGASTGPTTYATVTALMPAKISPAGAVTVNAPNQALLSQSAATAAAAAALAVTLPMEFNWNNLPPAAKARYENHFNPSHLMTESGIHSYPTPTRRVCPVLSYLDPSMGTGVTCQLDLNQLISQNGQFFPLANQGNSGLKVYLTSVPSCNGVSAEPVHI